MMKGVILAGGLGTRMMPLTRVTNKHLLPVYNKPMIYYPLSTLMQAGITEILLISTPDSLPIFMNVLGDGSRWGLSILYAAQPQPRGIADAFLIAADFIRGETVGLALGDNIFLGASFSARLDRAAKISSGALIFAQKITDPRDYAVIEFMESATGTLTPLGIEEKPEDPNSRYAVPGLYFYDEQVVEIARSLRPSARDELEITDVNQAYLKLGALSVEILGRGVTWLDAGTPPTLHQASNFVQAMEEQSGVMVACPEETAYRAGYISAEQFQRLLEEMPDTQYKQYLAEILR